MSANVHPGMSRTGRIILLLLLLAPLTAAIPGLLREDSQATAPGGSDAAADDSDAHSTPIIGFAMSVHHIGDLDLYLDSVDQIADLGANSLLIVTPMYQDSVDSTDIRLVKAKCPTREQLLTIFRRARARGMTTSLLPIVLIENPEGDEWRGVLAPSDWAAWWSSYDAFLDYFLGIAVDAKVDLFSIGSELNSTEQQVEQWQRLTRTVRSRFDGRITYSANWDRFEKVPFWSLVDVMGVSSYFELLPREPEATDAELIAAWRTERDRMMKHAAHVGRPLLITEVGYPSLPWAARHPWNYVSDGEAADHEAQARCLRIFFDAWTGAIEPAGPVLGFYLYRWDPYHRGDSRDTGYGVVGKPGFHVVQQAFAEMQKPGPKP